MSHIINLIFILYCKTGPITTVSAVYLAICVYTWLLVSLNYCRHFLAPQITVTIWHRFMITDWFKILHLKRWFSWWKLLCFTRSRPFTGSVFDWLHVCCFRNLWGVVGLLIWAQPWCSFLRSFCAFLVNILLLFTTFNLFHYIL